jgi:hypothetical protein
MTLGRSPAVLSDPYKSRLIIPPPALDLTGKTDSSSHLHSRLVSAVVPLIGAVSSDNVNPDREDVSQAHSQFLRDLRLAEESATPMADASGMAGYSWLNFDEKLSLELEYAGIEGKVNPLHSVDCPIIQDLSAALEQESPVLAEANKWRRAISDLVEQRKDTIELRNRKHREWISMMNSFMAQEKAKAQAEKKKKKERAKQYMSTESD